MGTTALLWLNHEAPVGETWTPPSLSTASTGQSLRKPTPDDSLKLREPTGERVERGSRLGREGNGPDRVEPAILPDKPAELLDLPSAVPCQSTHPLRDGFPLGLCVRIATIDKPSGSAAKSTKEGGHALPLACQRVPAPHALADNTPTPRDQRKTETRTKANRVKSARTLPTEGGKRLA